MKIKGKRWNQENHIKKQGAFGKSKRVRNKFNKYKMRNLLILVTLFVTFGTANAQSAKTAASNHVFIMCDEYGSPITSSGQSFYLAFYENSQLIMMCGSDLSRAISNKKANPATSKTGTWQSSGGRLWFTWSDGKRSEDWIVDSYSGNFKSGTTMLKDMGKF